jgi:hypothetical protein
MMLIIRFGMAFLVLHCLFDVLPSGIAIAASQCVQALAFMTCDADQPQLNGASWACVPQRDSIRLHNEGGRKGKCCLL